MRTKLIINKGSEWTRRICHAQQWPTPASGAEILAFFTQPGGTWQTRKLLNEYHNGYLFVTCKNCEVAMEAALRPYGLNIQFLQEFLRISNYNPDLTVAGLAINPDVRKSLSHCQNIAILNKKKRHTLTCSQVAKTWPLNAQSIPPTQQLIPLFSW